MGNKITKENMATKEPNKEANKESTREPNQELNKDQTKEPKKSAFQRLLARLQIGPNKPEKMSSKTPNTNNAKPQAPPPKPPLRNHAERMQTITAEPVGDTKKSEWTEVPLQVAESPPKYTHEQEIKVTPVPPPRKHKIRLQDILDSPKRLKELQDQAPSIPVEEPIIVAKKVVEHVCDGTHHHVRNVVNGTVVDQIVPTEHMKREAKPSKSAKHASTLSLPSYNDMKKKDDKRTSSPTKGSKKKSSASSLPTDKKPKTAHSAAEKIESYMIRCKSFGSIIPHAKSEKSKPIEPDSDKESIDSWSGLEDWDLGIIEHDVSADLPQTPLKTNIRRKRRTSPQKDNAKFNKKIDMTGIDQLLASIDDDVPDKKYDKKIEVIKSSSILEQPSPHHHSSYPFKKAPGKSTFENNTFATTEFIKHESNYCSNFQTPNYNKLAPLAAFDSDKESEKDANYYEYMDGDPDAQKITDKVNLLDSKEITTEPKKVSDDKNEKKITIFNIEKDVPRVIPRRKSSSGHSKLLKFIKNSKDDKGSENKITTSININDDNQKNHAVNEKDVIHKIEEPKIVPEIKPVDRSWHNLIKIDDLNDIPLLEQESSISDLVETSSDDTRSTTIETFQK